MSELAINGGPKVRDEPFPPWPHFFDDEIEEVERVLREARSTTGREPGDGSSRSASPAFAVPITGSQS